MLLHVTNPRLAALHKCLFSRGAFVSHLCVKMFDAYAARSYLLLVAALWSLSLTAAWPGISGSKLKGELDPNVKDWGDYSDLPPGIEQGLGLDEEGQYGDKRGLGESSSSLAPELDFLVDIAGKQNSVVI